MRIPFGERARHRDDQPGLRGGRLELLRMPAFERMPHRLARIVAAEQLQHAIAMMWEIRVQPHPPAIAAAVKPGNLVPELLRRLAVDAHVALAAKLDRGIAHIDADGLLPAAAEPPQLRRRKRRGCDARLRGGADGKRGGERRLASAQGHRLERSIRLARNAPQRGERFLRIWPSVHAPTVSAQSACC